MRVSSLVRPVSTVVVREGRRVCVPRVVVAPVVHIYRRTVRQLLSGSVHAYESPPPPPATCVLPDVVASFDGITPHVYRRSHLFLIFPYLATKDVKLTCVLCYVALLCLRLRLSSALCISSTSVDYTSSGTIRQISFTARCLLAAYPGIQQMVLVPPYITSHSLPPFLQCHVHFANLC